CYSIVYSCAFLVWIFLILVCVCVCVCVSVKGFMCVYVFVSVCVYVCSLAGTESAMGHRCIWLGGDSLVFATAAVDARGTLPLPELTPELFDSEVFCDRSFFCCHYKCA